MAKQEFVLLDEVIAILNAQCKPLDLNETERELESSMTTEWAHSLRTLIQPSVTNGGALQLNPMSAIRNPI
ncbi:unnamed protein product [Allacma fusca]|uniref:Uncharacterized protein n=1 Tax=Allacma fusca TaxID=39272 RepID=A0A8J2PCZ4_9HEXA|nr:unnamed protein product [Allacma fusca]